MARLEDHPTVRAVRAHQPTSGPAHPLSARTLRELCLACGADDVGFVSIDRPELDDQRDTILAAWPQTRTLISLVCRMNREPVRNPARSIANLEFHSTTEQVNLVTRDLVRRLDDMGVAALNPSAGFPMEMSQFPGKIWVVSHKPVAVAAGLGQMGIHRNVIHPKFGNFIILGTVLLAVDVDLESRPIDYNPCLECKLCVAACPVGAIKPDGRFDPSACLTHNYREFMSGFSDWVEQVADSPSAASYRQRMTDAETASLWQSLSFGANYKAAYCLAVCPAGEDVIAPFLANRSQFLEAQVKPLQEKLEPVYVVKESDAEEYVKKRFPHKTVRPVGGVRPTSIEGFLSGMHIVFQTGKSRGLDCVYHFTFTGREPAQATVTIRNQTLTVERGLVGNANCRIVADSTTWMGFLRKERNIVWAIFRRQVRVWGGLGKLIAFGKCFPS